MGKNEEEEEEEENRDKYTRRTRLRN